MVFVLAAYLYWHLYLIFLKAIVQTKIFILETLPHLPIKLFSNITSEQTCCFYNDLICHCTTNKQPTAHDTAVTYCSNLLSLALGAHFEPPQVSKSIPYGFLWVVNSLCWTRMKWLELKSDLFVSSHLVAESQEGLTDWDVRSEL